MKNKKLDEWLNHLIILDPKEFEFEVYKTISDMVKSPPTYFPGVKIKKMFRECADNTFMKGLYQQKEKSTGKIYVKRFSVDDVIWIIDGVISKEYNSVDELLKQFYRIKKLERVIEK